MGLDNELTNIVKDIVLTDYMIEHSSKTLSIPDKLTLLERIKEAREKIEKVKPYFTEGEFKGWGSLFTNPMNLQLSLSKFFISSLSKELYQNKDWENLVKIEKYLNTTEQKSLLKRIQHAKKILKLN